MCIPQNIIVCGGGGRGGGIYIDLPSDCVACVMANWQLPPTMTNTQPLTNANLIIRSLQTQCLQTPGWSCQESFGPELHTCTLDYLCIIEQSTARSLSVKTKSLKI